MISLSRYIYFVVYILYFIDLDLKLNEKEFKFQFLLYIKAIIYILY